MISLFNRFSGVLVLLLGSLLPVQSVLASKPVYQVAPVPIVLAARQGAVSLDDAVRQVLDRTGGRVLKASRRGQMYVIKVLMPSGVVRKFRIRAN